MVKYCFKGPVYLKISACLMVKWLPEPHSKLPSSNKGGGAWFNYLCNFLKATISYLH